MTVVENCVRGIAKFTLQLPVFCFTAWGIQSLMGKTGEVTWGQCFATAGLFILYDLAEEYLSYKGRNK